jgi:hypothetical protein
VENPEMMVTMMADEFVQPEALDAKAHSTLKVGHYSASLREMKQK